MAKGLFTSSEEITFQNAYVHGLVTQKREPNAGRNPVKARLCAQNKRTVKVVNVFSRHR